MILILLFALGLFFLVRRYSQLSSIPGPFLAGITDLWRWTIQNYYSFDDKLTALHQKHGKLVRIGPNMVSIGDPEAASTIYGSNPALEKGPSYGVTVGVANGKLVQNLLSVDNAQHAKIVKAIGSAFTQGAVLEFESAVDDSAKRLVLALTKTDQQTVDLARWCQLFGMDVLSYIAFAESPGYLEEGRDVNGFIGASEGRNEYWYTHAAIPNIDYFMTKGPLARLLRTPVSLLGRTAVQKFKERRMAQEAEKHNDLLQRYMDAQSRYPDDITDSHVAGLVVTSIAAGADTAATTLAATLLLVLQHPPVHAKLLEELASLDASSEIPKWNDVAGLPYLDATIKESMRYFPAAAFTMDRVVPEGGMTIAETFLPSGTVVACHIDTLHRDTGVYGEDANIFRPERWTEASEEQLRRMTRAFIGFGNGKRICIGRHLATVEMKKVLPLILRSFIIKIKDEELHRDIREGSKPSAVRYLRPIPVSLEKRDSSH